MKRKDPIHFFLQSASPAWLRSQNRFHTQWLWCAGPFGTCGSRKVWAGWSQKGSGQEPGLQAVLAKPEDGGFITAQLGGCPGCAEERLGKVSHSNVTPPPATFWTLAVRLWVFSAQPGPSCLLLLSHLYVVLILCLHAVGGVSPQRSSDVQEKIIKANQPVRQHFLLLTPVCIPAENPAGDPKSPAPVHCSRMLATTGRTAVRGAHFGSPRGFWGSFLSTQSYPESPETQ